MASPGQTTDMHSREWVLVQHESQYTRSRSPQYNPDNESQAEKANTSCAVSIVLVPDEEEEESRVVLSRKTESNGSTETTASKDTMTAADKGGPARTLTTSSTHTAAQDLTQSTLDLHQRLHQAPYGAVLGWLAETSGGLDRFAIDFGSSAHHSMLAQMGRSPSSVSSFSMLDFDATPPTRCMMHDIREIGSWCATDVWLSSLVHR